jgi:probable HAF family extracellular repeat protein
VGTAFESPGGGSSWAAFLAQNGQAKGLGTFAGLAPETSPFSAAYAVNNAGEAVGTSGANVGGWGNHAFKTGPAGAGPLIDLGTLGGAHAAALGINSAAWVVGSSTLSGNAWDPTHAFPYQGTSMVDLNALIPPTTAWTLTSATAIDDQGRIAAYGTDVSGQTHRLLLTPGTPEGQTVPEPSAWLVFGMALAAVCWRGRWPARRA